MTLFDDGLERIVMRKPCTRCGGPDGVVRRISGQDTVRCDACGAFQYNRPRSEAAL